MTVYLNMEKLIQKALQIQKEVGCLSIPLLERRLKIESPEAKRIMREMGQEIVEKYDPTLTPSQRYYRKHKKVKNPKPRTYYFKEYWAKEWEKCINGKTIND